jgi:hypothetical protein
VTVRVSLLALLTVAVGGACGERVVELDPLLVVDAAVDAPGPAPCVAGTTQCTNCLDDDDDGEIDGFDVECTGGIDDDEGAFWTGLPGEGTANASQDCFFDGDSGSGNDGCDRHACCILGLDAAGCAAAGIDNSFDPATDCPDVSAECVASCPPLVPPGCDCFGCCNVCDGATCYDIYIHPGFAPQCDSDVLADPALCPRCSPLASCRSGCTAGASECETSADCGAGAYCAAGCCIAVVE